MKNKTVSLVITSCNRFDLLEKTLDSFLKYNTYPIEQYIIIEDSHNIDKLYAVLKKFSDISFTVLHNPIQLGQMKSIDRAYKEVTSDYIFHCEDDWVFYRSGFIEDSFEVLESNDKIITVWLREQNDTNGHPVDPEIFECKNKSSLQYQLMIVNHQKNENSAAWHGFTFNPGLRRLKDYLLVAPIANYTGELALSDVYYEQGFRGAIFPEGYVEHIGWHRGIRYKVDIANWRKDFSVSRRKIQSYLANLFK